MGKYILAILVSFILIFSSCRAFSEISFGILPFEAKPGVSDSDKESAESSFYLELVESGRYQVVDRNRIRQILKEQAFQTSDWVDPSKVVKIGRIIGVEKFIICTIYKGWGKEWGEPSVTIRVIDLETAEIELSENIVPVQSRTGISASDLARRCASLIISKYPLLGNVLGKSGDIYVVGLGKNNSLNIGDHLFVARKDILKSDDGEILFEKYNRIGTLVITELDEERSMTKLYSIEDPKISLKKGDMVSPEPLPEKEPIISYVPLLPDVKKGKLILNDDMSKGEYLNPIGNDVNVQAYKDGKLHFRSLSNIKQYCFYPAPFDRLENFIMEGEVTIMRIKGSIQNFQVYFRSSEGYPKVGGYCFYWTQGRGYGIYKNRFGNFSDLLPKCYSYDIKWSNSKNKFRIVAYGSKFDCYINDKFLVGFEDEYYKEGKIGLMAETDHYTNVNIDSIKIWEALRKP